MGPVVFAQVRAGTDNLNAHFLNIVLDAFAIYPDAYFNRIDVISDAPGPFKWLFRVEFVYQVLNLNFLL